MFLYHDGFLKAILATQKNSIIPNHIYSASPMGKYVDFNLRSYSICCVTINFLETSAVLLSQSTYAAISVTKPFTV